MAGFSMEAANLARLAGNADLPRRSPVSQQWKVNNRKRSSDPEQWAGSLRDCSLLWRPLLSPLLRPLLRLHCPNPHVSIFVVGHPHTTSSCRPGDCQHSPWKSRESPLFRSFLVLARHRDYPQDRVRRNGLVRRSGSRDSNGLRSLSLPPESEVLASTTRAPRHIPSSRGPRWSLQDLPTRALRRET